MSDVTRQIGGQSLHSRVVLINRVACGTAALLFVLQNFLVLKWRVETLFVWIVLIANFLAFAVAIVFTLLDLALRIMAAIRRDQLSHESTGGVGFIAGLAAAVLPLALLMLAVRLGGEFSKQLASM